MEQKCVLSYFFNLCRAYLFIFNIKSEIFTNVKTPFHQKWNEYASG